MISGSDKFQNVPSHQEVSGLADVDNINTFTFTDSVYAFEDVTNEPRDNTFNPFNLKNNRQDFRAKIDSAFNRNLPNSFKSGSSVLKDNLEFADLTMAKEQNILPNPKSPGNRDEETFLVVSDVADGEDRNVDEQQQVTDDFADSVNTHHEPASVLPESSDIRNSVHRAQGQLPRHEDHPMTNEMTNEEEEADSKKESRIVDTLDSNKIIVDDSSKSLDNKQILWRSEDISLLNDQDILLETRTDPSKEQHRQRLPKQLHESLSNRNKEFTFVDLPNLDQIDDFATVIEKNDTEGNVRRTVIIKNIPEAIQAFGVRNAPLQRNTFREMLDQGTKIAPDIENPSTENIQRLETSIFDPAPNVVSKNNDNNKLNGDVVLETESRNNHGNNAGKLKILGANSEKLDEALVPKSDINKVSIAPHIEKPSTENIEVHETFFSTLDPAPNAVSKEHNDERLNARDNETNNNHEDIVEKKLQANSDKSKETFMLEDEENNITIDKNELFQTFINNDTNGNVQRTIVIKNTPEALKMFGIENVPFLLKKKTESDSIRALNEQIDKVFDEEENENLFVIHDNEEATDFEYRNDDHNFIVDYEADDLIKLDSNAFNPLQKLRLNAKKASNDFKIESEEESQTLKTLFYEDLSQENIFVNEPNKSLDDDDNLKAFEFKSPELDLTINSVNVNDIMDDIDIDLFNLKQSDERMSKVFSEIFSSDINNGAGLIEDSPIIGKHSDQEQTIEHSEQGEHFSKILTQDLFNQDNSSPTTALNQFETILVSTKDPIDKSEELPLIHPGEFIVYSEEFLDTDPLSEADLSPSPDPRLHSEQGGNNLIFPDKISFAKNSAISEGQTVTVIGSDNFLSKSPEPELVIPSTLDHEQNNQFLSSSQISSFLSSNKSPSGTNTAHINDQKTQKPEENHQVEISSNLHSGDNNVLTSGSPDHDIVKNQNTGPTFSIDINPDNMIFSNVNNKPQHSKFVRFPTDDATVFSNNDIFSAENQNIPEENNLNNVINNQNKAISHNNNKLNRNNNIFPSNQKTRITSGINHNQHAVIPSNDNNVFNININSNGNIISNSNNKDTNLKTSNNIVTPVPMNFRSASGLIRIPVTFQYGFEPITEQPQRSDASRAPPPLFSPTPRSKSSLLKKPLRIPKRINNLKHFVRSRKTNVVEFYQQPTVLDRFSGWFDYLMTLDQYFIILFYRHHRISLKIC